jgi:hypothetical protein
MSRIHQILAAVENAAVKEAPIHYVDPGLAADLAHHLDPRGRSDPQGLLSGDFLRGRQDRFGLLGAVNAAFNWNGKPAPKRKRKPPPAPVRRRT